MCHNQLPSYPRVCCRSAGYHRYNYRSTTSITTHTGPRRNRGSSPIYELLNKAPKNGDEVEGFVNLQRKPRLRAYGVAFGVTCKAAEHLLEAAEASLRASTLLPVYSLATPLVAWFDAGRLMRCPLLIIPDSTGPKPLPQLLDELVATVLKPHVEEPKSCLDVLTILRSHELPFEWVATFPARRALLLAATARAVGIDRQPVTDERLAYRGILKGDLQQKWRDIVTFIVSVLWGSKTLRH